MSCRRLLLLAAAISIAAAPAVASPPLPLTPVRFAFPGSVLTPTSAVSAGLALSDRAVSQDAAGNPAARTTRTIVVAPQLLRVSRQDLSASNREFEQVVANLDFAAGQLSVPVRSFWLSLYAWQPELRLENQSFVLGRTNGVGSSASIVNDAGAREARIGVAAGRGEALRWGAAVEWNLRQDRYQSKETSGSPDAGVRDLDLKGNAPGAALGVRWERAPERSGGVVVGLATHFTGPMELTGTNVATLTSGVTRSDVTVTRASTWDATAGTRCSLTPESGAYASVVLRSAQDWDSFGVAAGAGTSWSAGIDFHDAEIPWTLRAGLGQDVQPGTPEPRAGLISLGLSWNSGETTVDLGILHRTLLRPGQPKLSDDRVVAAIRVAL